MPIAYAERKKRRQALLQGLVPELRQRLALRHVEAVIKLPQEAQRTLAEALVAGLHNIPVAISILQKYPRASAEEVLRARKDGRQKESPASEVSAVELLAKDDPAALAELSGLLQDCFPGMPRMTAEALAADELFSEVLALVRMRRKCLNSRLTLSELVLVALCGLALSFIDELNQLMDSRKYYLGALQQSGLYPHWAAHSHNNSSKFWPLKTQPINPEQAPP
jgi:hypothetical protein